MCSVFFSLAFTFIFFSFNFSISAVKNFSSGILSCFCLFNGAFYLPVSVSAALCFLVCKHCTKWACLGVYVVFLRCSNSLAVNSVVAPTSSGQRKAGCDLSGKAWFLDLPCGRSSVSPRCQPLFSYLEHSSTRAVYR